ncbi:MAG TPA: efflux transporter outer membrane subunit [Burkholderiales bacterium]|nr:efflux transporter outer membrane subunit [Burkholderiales bacterium]
MTRADVILRAAKDVLFASFVALLAGCSVGPDYVRPDAPVPQAFKETQGWKPAEPRDAEVRGSWWETFGDPLLNQLEEQVSVSNQNVAAAEARFRQAMALIGAARAQHFPTITGDVSATRSRSSSGSNSAVISRGVVTSRNAAINADWELDVWGRVRRTVESNVAGAQASAGDLESARLSAQVQLAQSYFQLRQLDTERRLLDDTVQALGVSLELTRNRYSAGVAAKVDVVQAQTLLKTTQAQAIDLGVQRAQLEHAIALLAGKAPAELAIPPGALGALPPPAPVGLPSALLERRPDIAAAERRMAQANAQIGVAKAAYFPQLTLSGTIGYQATSLANWFTAPSRFWSVGPAVAATLFDAGLRKSQTEQAIANYDATVATYRQTVLTALQDVEDNVAALRILEEEAVVQREALEAARQTLELTLNQYKGGVVSYLNVVTAQTTALQNERTAVDLQSRRLQASVLLVRALGGGWSPRAAR